MKVFADKAGGKVELVKDCDCIDHDGPHWLYSNDKWRESNAKLLEKAKSGTPGSFYAFSGAIAEESARLAARLHAFKIYGIERVFYEND